MEKILIHHPKEYLKQGLMHCGAYSVKGILSAYGRDVKKDPRDYEVSIFARLVGITNGLTNWPKVLKDFGIDAGKGSANNLSKEQRLSLLKKLIDEDKPVMVRIGNGYLQSGRYSKFIASFMGHWITLWGYNDEERIFYVYDSCVPLARHDKNIPIGNTKRTYAEILRDWGKGFPFNWRYTFISAIK